MVYKMIKLDSLGKINLLVFKDELIFPNESSLINELMINEMIINKLMINELIINELIINSLIKLDSFGKVNFTDHP